MVSSFAPRYLDLRECLEAADRWTSAASQHLERSAEAETADTSTEDVFSQIRQLDYLLSRSRELRLRTRMDFEDSSAFAEVKESLSPQSLFAVDDALERMEAAVLGVMARGEEMRARATR